MLPIIGNSATALDPGQAASSADDLAAREAASCRFSGFGAAVVLRQGVRGAVVPCRFGWGAGKSGPGGSGGAVRAQRRHEHRLLGSGRGADLVFVIGWIVSALEVAWEGPPRAFFERLASFSRLILMDKRGTGLSDRVEGIPNLETRMDDVRAVMDAVGSERAAIFGVSEGGPMAALFAATSPARTAALILEGTTATFHADQRSPVAGDARGAVALAEFRSGVGDLGQQRMG